MLEPGSTVHVIQPISTFFASFM